MTLDLSSDEALVLLEWLVGFSKTDPEFADQAEQRVLWDVEAMLERQIDVIFSPDYSSRLAAARGRVRDAIE